jgi:hypothetical protein
MVVTDLVRLLYDEVVGLERMVDQPDRSIGSPAEAADLSVVPPEPTDIHLRAEKPVARARRSP